MNFPSGTDWRAVCPLFERGLRKEETLANEVRIKLTEEQQARIKETTGRDVEEIRVGSFGKNPALSTDAEGSALRSTTTRANSLKASSMKANSLKANSLKASSMKANSLKANSLKASSMKANSLKANSLKASSMKANSLKANSLKASSMKANSLKANSLKGTNNF